MVNVPFSASSSSDHCIVVLSPFRNIGNVCGYIIIPLFSYVNFDLAGVKIDKLNASGFFAAILFLVCFVLTAALYFDLSQLGEEFSRETNEQSRPEIGDAEQSASTTYSASTTASALPASASVSGQMTAASVGREKEEEEEGEKQKKCCCCCPSSLSSMMRSSFEAFKENMIR